MLKVGLTGGIGSGKSVVARVLSVLGVPVFDADTTGKNVLITDQPLVHAVMARFGDAIYHDGRLDRSALAAIVFNDKQALADLNALVHPSVRASFDRWCEEQRAPYVVMEAAILAETGGYKAFDRIVVVSAPEDLRVKRVMDRDQVGEEVVNARLRNQTSEEARLGIAHHVIVNDDHRLVIPQVLAIHTELINFASA